LNLKQTSLYPLYTQYGAKTVEFGGWDMPVQFSSILLEHESVRERAGLFDVSHMGEFEVTGVDARAFVQYMVTNDVSIMTPGMALYSPMTYPTGGCVDDLLVYCFSEEHFDIVVNAGNIDKDFDWLSQQAPNFDVKLRDKSSDVSLLAIQGPRAVSIVQSLTTSPVSELGSFRFLKVPFVGVDVIVSRTGYTGEDGFELYVPSSHAAALWRELMTAGESAGLVPCGLGCRDTLRLEARLPLYGHELTQSITPLEAGLGMFVKLNAGDFIGREALLLQKSEGIPRKLVGVQLMERGIPRAGYPIYHQGVLVGEMTSGTMSPTLKLPLGLALINTELAIIDTELDVEIRGKLVKAKIVKAPFYRRQK
jgi:aminomethyltransferase